MKSKNGIYMLEKKNLKLLLEAENQRTVSKFEFRREFCFKISYLIFSSFDSEFEAWFWEQEK